jgi:hypothetical protein
MKSIISIIVFALTSSCKSLNRFAYDSAPEDPISMKLLPLKKSGIDGFKTEEEELDNVCESAGTKYGYIVYSGNSFVKNRGAFYSILCIPHLGLPLFLGVPLFVSVADAQVSYEIQNYRHERIAIFSSQSKANVPCAFYYGYGIVNAPYKSVIDANRIAHKEIRKQLTPEVVIEINRKLKEAGPISAK